MKRLMLLVCSFLAKSAKGGCGPVAQQALILALFRRFVGLRGADPRESAPMPSR
jgi:hypothetical protein